MNSNQPKPKEDIQFGQIVVLLLVGGFIAVIALNCIVGLAQDVVDTVKGNEQESSLTNCALDPSCGAVLQSEYDLALDRQFQRVVESDLTTEAWVELTQEARRDSR